MIIILGCSCQAKLEIGGTIFAEFISDPKNFDPSVSRTDPWRSGDQGGLVFPGYYVGQFTKLNLNLKIIDRYLEAFVPMTLSVNPFSIGSGSITWQAVMVAEDYLNIPYYFSMKAPNFTFSASSRPLSDVRFGFHSFNDPLGIIKRPNSLQPILTFKIDAEMPNNYFGKGYVLFDQAVSGLPIWEQIPQTVKNEVLGGKKISDYGFIDEVPQYTLARVEKILKYGQLGIFVGQKSVENPYFRTRKIDGSLSSGTAFTRWGYEKSNYGFDIATQIGSILQINSGIVGSDVKWFKYDSDRINEDHGYFIKRWYPSELRGELSGLAGSFSAEVDLGSNRFSFETIVVEPDFQAVAAVHDQFSPLERLVPRSSTESVLERKTQMLYDPTGSLFGKVINSSAVVDYLGKRSLGITFAKEGYLGIIPVTFTIHSKEIRSLDTVSKLDKDTKTGAYLLKDQRGVNVSISSSDKITSWVFEGQNTNFLANQDYLQALRLTTNHGWGCLSLANTLERVWRLKGAGFENTEGATNKLTTKLSGEIGQTKYMLGFDLRQGSYDYDLLEPISDQVVPVYSYLGLSAYLEKSYEFKVKNRIVKLSLAGEMIKRETDLPDVQTGSSLVGYFNANYPLSSKWEYGTTNIFVNGPEDLCYPSGRLNNVSHNELVYIYSKDALVRFGYTILDNQHQNGFIDLKLALGQGNLGVSLGRGAAPIFKEGIDLPGILARQDFYHQNYLPSQSLADRPWQNWDTNNFYALWQNQLRSTQDAWAGYMMVNYWYSF